MRTIFFGGAVAFPPRGGAPWGASAIPLMIFAFFGGWKRGSPGPPPPVAAETLSLPDEAPPVLAAIETDGTKHANRSMQALSSVVRKRGGISLSSAYGVS